MHQFKKIIINKIIINAGNTLNIIWTIIGGNYRQHFHDIYTHIVESIVQNMRHGRFLKNYTGIFFSIVRMIFCIK